MKIPDTILFASCALFLSACVNLEPNPDLSRSFVLGPVDFSESSQGLDGGALYVMRPQLPSFLDSNRIQYRDAIGLVESVEDAFWAESLPEGVSRAFAQYFGQRSGLGGIAYYPWPEPGVEVDKIVLKFQRFDAITSGEVYVKASWELKSGSNGKHSGSLNVSRFVMGSV